MRTPRIDDPEFRETGCARPFRDDWTARGAAALRHYHPPPALYPAALLLTFGERREHVLRLVPLTTALLASMAAAWLAWMLAMDLPAPRRAFAVTMTLAACHGESATKATELEPELADSPEVRSLQIR